MIGLVIATRLEAAPFIDGLGLTVIARQPFEIYTGDELALVLCGIGKTNAAMAVTYFMEHCRPNLVCNLGAAGAVSDGYALGEVFQIDRVLEPDRPDLTGDQPKEHRPDRLDGFRLSGLATQDRPVRTAAERSALASSVALADMEAAAVLQVCRRFDRPCYFFKYVSDTPDHPTSRDIVANIERLRDGFFRAFEQEILPALQRVMPDGQA